MRQLLVRHCTAGYVLRSLTVVRSAWHSIVWHDGAQGNGSSRNTEG